MKDRTQRENDAVARWLAHERYWRGLCSVSPYVADASLPLEEQYNEIERCEALANEDWPIVFALAKRGLEELQH